MVSHPILMQPVLPIWQSAAVTIKLDRRFAPQNYWMWEKSKGVDRYTLLLTDPYTSNKTTLCLRKLNSLESSQVHMRIA